MEVKVCKACITPSTRPRIAFDQNGICNACNYALTKESIDWEARKNELQEILEKHRSRDGSYDCVVPWSGGKDSSSIAYRLKFEYGMNPLLVTFSPLIPNEIGAHNREALIRKGFDHLMVRPNQQVARHLARRFFIERGNQKVAWDAGVTALPVQIACRYGIKLIFYAEHGESEYGGRVLHANSSKIRDLTEVLEHLVGDDPRNWVDEVVSERDLNPYLYPERDVLEQVQPTAYYFAYFYRWSMYQNYLFIKDKIDFRTCEHGRTEGTFTNFDSLDDKTDNLYYYLQYIKFGFGRATRDASRMIQNHQMTREQGLELATKYDDEFPLMYHGDNLEYLGLSESQFAEVIDRHRNPELWAREENRWKLKFSVS